MMMMMMMIMMYRCWFGEKHPSTGNETWKVEVCQDNEDHCYQVSQAEGTQHTGQGSRGVVMIVDKRTSKVLGAAQL